MVCFVFTQTDFVNIFYRIQNENLGIYLVIISKF